MFAHLGTIGSFCLDWLRAASIGGSIPVLIGKFITIVFTTICALADNSRLRTEVLSGTGEDSKIVFIPWQPNIGVLFLIGVVLIWGSVAFGTVWVRFKSLKIGESIGRDPEHTLYRFSIENAGFSAVDVPVYAIKVTDADGNFLPVQERLPLELRWMHYDQGKRPTLSRGIIEKVDLLCIGGSSVGPDGWEITLAIVGLGGNRINIGKIASTTKNRMWMLIKIGDTRTERWVSVETGESPSECIVEFRDPPFLAKEPQLLSRALALVRRILSVICDGERRKSTQS